MSQENERNVVASLTDSLMQVATAVQMCEEAARHNRDQMVANGWSKEAAEDVSLDMFYSPLRRAMNIDE